MTLKIISPSQIVFEGTVTSVSLPGAMGSFTVLRNHAAIISTLVEGNISYREKEGEEPRQYAIKGGIVDVADNVVSVCVY